MTPLNVVSIRSEIDPLLARAASAGVVAGATAHTRCEFDSAGLAVVAVVSLRGESSGAASARLDSARKELAAVDKARAEAELERATASRPPAPAAVPPSSGLVARIRGWFRRRPAPQPIEPLEPELSRADILRQIRQLEALVQDLAALEGAYKALFDAEFKSYLDRAASLPLRRSFANGGQS